MVHGIRETNLSSFLRVQRVRLFSVQTRVLSWGNVYVIFCRKVSIGYIFLLVFCFSSANVAPLVFHICISALKGIDSMPKEMLHLSLNRMYASFYITEGQILVWVNPFNIPSLARQRCLSSWGPRRTPWFFCNFSTV